MTGWRLGLMLIALLVPGGTLLLLAWAAARAYRADHRVAAPQAPLQLAPALARVRRRGAR
jgi:hypothetical protein